MIKIIGVFRRAYLFIRTNIPALNISLARWLYLPRILSSREKIILYSLLAVFFLSGIAFFTKTYLRLTVIKPAFGGTYREGLLREPRFINPIYASSNDSDRDITELVFSGLVRYTPGGEAVPDLAESIEISEDGRVYNLRLRAGLRWHDGETLDADDVLFTVKTVQNPEFKSPYRQNWQGVSVEKLDAQTVTFTLKQPYAPFIENLTLGIIPEHLWANVSPQSAPLSELNLKPIGSGPYRFKSFTKRNDGSITSYTLSAFRYAPHGKPYIKEISFTFHQSEAEMIAAYRKGEIDGISTISARSLPQLEKTDLTITALRIPQVIGLFFNNAQQNAFSDKNVRLALAYAIDKQKIIYEILGGAAETVASPLPPASQGFNAEISQIQYDPERAKELLAKAGWKDGDGVVEKSVLQGRTKTAVPLKIEISTSDFPELAGTASVIKSMWETIGAKVDVKILSSSELETSIIRPRSYQTLLFGEIFGHDPDPFAFWHTSQIRDPGLNIALYSNRKVDAILEEARRTTLVKQRIELYREFQRLITEDAAAIFLFSPVSFYGTRNTVQGADIDKIALPHERFSWIETWYIKTRRGLK